MHSTEELIHHLRERAALERRSASGDILCLILSEQQINALRKALDDIKGTGIVNRIFVMSDSLLTEAADELERLYRALPLDRT